MKILISGGNGGLAKEIIKNNNRHDILAPTKVKMDVRNNNQLISNICSFKPDIFLHAAALTRPMKKHIENPEESISSNILGTTNVVLSCFSYNKTYNKNIKLIYISTDYVYPGIKGNYSEEDPLLPVNEYAWSKLGGECAVKLYPNHLILRTCMSSYPFPHKKALVDSYKSYMYQSEVSKIILKLIRENIYGIINVGGEKQSAYDFAKNEFPVEEISLIDVDEKLAVDSSMDVSKLKKLI